MTGACCPGCTRPHPLLAWVMSWHCLARRWSQNLNPGQPDSRACVNSASCCIRLKVCVWTGEPFVKPTFCADLFLGRSSMSWNPFAVALCSWAEGDSLRRSGLAISMLIRAEGTKNFAAAPTTSRGFWSRTLWRAAGPPSHSQRSMCPPTGSWPVPGKLHLYPRSFSF